MNLEPGFTENKSEISTGGLLETLRAGIFEILEKIGIERESLNLLNVYELTALQSFGIGHNPNPGEDLECALLALLIIFPELREKIELLRAINRKAISAASG